MTTTTCTAGALQGLLADIIRFAGDDPTLPMLNGVLLHTVKHNGGVLLVATATDRFVMAQTHIDATGVLPKECFIRLGDVRRLLALLKLASNLVELSVTGDAFAVAGSGVQCSVTLERSDFPKVAEIMSKTYDTESGPVRFNARLLERFTAVA